MPNPGFEPSQNPDLQKETQPEYGWEKVLERDAASSRFLNTRLFLENVPGIDEDSTGKIRSLDTFLSQQLQEVLDEQYEELVEAKKSKDEIEEALKQTEKRYTEELSDPEIKAAVEEIIFRAEHSKITGSEPKEQPKLRKELAALEEFILNKLKQRQPQEEAQLVPVEVHDAEEVPPGEVQHRWKQEYVAYKDKETGKISYISVGSYFALESAMAFINNPESALAHHVYSHIGERNTGKRRRFSAEDLESVTFRDKFPNFERYLQIQFRNYKKKEHNSPRLPEEAQGEEDAIRLLSDSELKGWFTRRYREYCEDHKVFEENIPEDERTRREDAAVAKFQRDGYTKLYFSYFPEENPERTTNAEGVSNLPAVVDQLPPDEEGQVGTPEDLATHRERWDRQRQALERRTYEEPLNMHDLKVPAGFVAEFYNRSEGESDSYPVGAELGNKISHLEVDWHGLRDGYITVKFTAKVEDRRTGRFIPNDFDFVFNLPNEARVAAENGDTNAIEEAAKECIIKNQGSPYIQARYDRSSGNMLYGFGPKDNPEVGVKFSAQGLRDIAGSRAGEVVDYMDRRAKGFKQLDFEKEVEPMWAFERYLLTLEVPKANKKMAQLIKDEVFLQLWKQRIGEEKLAELTTQFAEQKTIGSGNGQGRRDFSSPRGPGKYRYERSQDEIKSIAESAAGKKFLGLINAEYGEDYEAFLRSAKFWEYKQQAQADGGFRMDDAMSLVAEKVLLEKGRQADYKEFLEFTKLPNSEKAQFLRDNGFNVAGATESSLLKTRLLLFLNPSEEVKRSTSIRTKADLNRDRRNKRQTSGGTTERVIQPEQPEDRSRTNEILRQMDEQVKQQVAGEYNEEDDLDLLIGNAKV